jgi:hypothetical protein
MLQPVPVNMAARYRALETPWLHSSAGNTYGTTNGMGPLFNFDNFSALRRLARSSPWSMIKW